MRSLASLPYFFSIRALKSLKAIAGSVVVPDLEITFIEKSLSLHMVKSSASSEEEMELPAKYISGVSFLI